MRQKILGNSGLCVSQLTIGCWSFGGDAQSYWGGQSQQDVDLIVAEALDRGVNLFDTAFVYNSGASEISLGKALLGKRKQAIICNKIPILDYDELPSYQEKIVGSLKRLNTDYLDLLLIHWPTQDEKLLRANLDALKNVRRQGLVRHIGVSNFGPRTLEIAGEEEVHPTADELVYNLISRGIEKQIIPYCLSHQIGILAYMPLMQGILTGKFASIDEIPAARKRTIHFSSAANPAARHSGPGVETELMELLIELKTLARQNGLSAGQLALAWLYAKEAVSSVIVGCRSIRQLDENIASAQISLTDEVMSKLDAAGEAILRRLGRRADLWEDEQNSRIW